MPARIIDFEALWFSEKLARCEEKNRVEYAWFYGLADANGSFEMNLVAIHAKVSAIRSRMTIRRIKDIFADFETHGLVFTWQQNGKCWAHFTKSDVPGRLPAISTRHRYKLFAPNVPAKELTEFTSRCCHDYIMTTSANIRTGVGVGVELDRDKPAATPAAHPDPIPEEEQRRRIKAKSDRLGREHEFNSETSVGSGPVIESEDLRLKISSLARNKGFVS